MAVPPFGFSNFFSSHVPATSQPIHCSSIQLHGLPKSLFLFFSARLGITLNYHDFFKDMHAVRRGVAVMGKSGDVFPLINVGVNRICR